MAGSELFTENFLVPVTTVVAGGGTWRDVGRLWAGTLSMNIVGGIVMVVLMMYAFPDLQEAASESGTKFIDRGIGVEGMASAILAGIVITLMTWMQRRKTMGTKLVAA